MLETEKVDSSLPDIDNLNQSIPVKSALFFLINSSSHIDTQSQSYYCLPKQLLPLTLMSVLAV